MTRLETIGTRLYELRKSKNITQEQLSEQLSVSRQSVSNWELDKSLPDMDKLLTLAVIYDVSLDYIAYGKKPEITDNHDKENLETISAGESANKSLLVTLLVAVVVCSTVLLVPILVIFVNIMSHLSGPSDLNSDIVSVNQIISQYSYAEVSKLDSDGNFAKDYVWLDTRNLTEDGYIFASTKPGSPKQMKFEYYSKTMMVPFTAIILLVIIDIIGIICIYRLKKPVK